MTEDAQAKPQHPWLGKYPVDIDWNAELKPTTMADMLRDSVARNADKIAMNFMGHKYTFRELDEMSDAFAKSLQQQGVVKGSKVGICLPNTPFYVVAYFGAMKAGATVVNFNPLYAEKEMEHLIKDSGCDLMVTVNVPQVQNTVDKMFGRTPLKKLIVCDIGDALPKVKGTLYKGLNAVKRAFGKKDATIRIKKDGKHINFKSMLKNDGKYTPVDVSVDDVAVLQYTGGTTGLPKAATLTHANLTSNLQQASLWFTGTADPSQVTPEKVLVILPFFHVFSMTVQMNLSVFRGDEIIMLPKFNLKETLQTIEKEKPTMFACVPSLYKAIIDSKESKKYDLSSLKVCVSGAAPLNEHIMKGFKDLTGIDIVEGYGLSETSPLACANPVHGAKKLNSVGLPAPQTEVRIINLELPDQETKINVSGEICLRGPQVMKGYWNKPEETANSIDKDGYFHTGDVGYLDEDGYLFIVDRIKDMVIVNGMKVFPRKVEDAILQHPGISEVIVIGVQDEQRGEAVKAFVVLREKHGVSKKEIMEFLKEHLANYEIPKQIDFRDSLPKTMIGKPDRKALKTEEAEKKTPPKPPAPKP